MELKKQLMTDGGWKFRILELQNQVMQNDVTLQVTNSKMFIEILVWSY